MVNDAKLEAFRYFDKNIRKLPKKSDGSFDETKPEFSNNDVDAFRHAYVSGVITIEYSSTTADILGRLNELVPSLSPNSDQNEVNMDLFNNHVGRQYAKKRKSRARLLDALHQALKTHELITDPADMRQYKGAGPIDRRNDVSIFTVEENRSGLNTLFFDAKEKRPLNRHEFILAINAGRYPEYQIRRSVGQLIPVSRRDSRVENNLG